MDIITIYGHYYYIWTPGRSPSRDVRFELVEDLFACVAINAAITHSRVTTVTTE